MSTSQPTRRVVVVEPGYESYATERAILASFGARIEPVAWNGDVDVIRNAVRGADAVLVRESPIDGDALAGLPAGTVVVRYGVGVDNIDLDVARRRQIYVANTPNYGIDAVSDHAMALMLAVCRRLVTRDREVRGGAWGVGQTQKIYGFRGKTIGFVGFGRIARRTHQKALPFGFSRALVFDPYLPAADAEAMNVEQVDMEALCRESDVVSLHAPLTDETRHILNAARIALMKPTAVLVNVGRGPLVDEAALIEALRDNRIFGAGIDVFDTEPPAPDNPLLALGNVVVSDHAAWYTEESVCELQTMAANEVARVFRGERPQAWVNRWEAR